MNVDPLLIEEKIIVHKDWFEWKLTFLNEPIKLEIIGKQQDCFVLEHKQKIIVILVFEWIRLNVFFD